MSKIHKPATEKPKHLPAPRAIIMAQIAKEIVPPGRRH